MVGKIIAYGGWGNVINVREMKRLNDEGKKAFVKGYRIDVWNENKLIDFIYNKNIDDINKYVRQEKEYIAKKQEAATLRNKIRKEKRKQKLAKGGL